MVPWSVTRRVPTAAGVRWFKANAPGCACEAALAEALPRRVPAATLEPLAADTARGWLLTADAGPTLRDRISPGERLKTWESMLRAYAGMQRALIPHSTTTRIRSTPPANHARYRSTATAPAGRRHPHPPGSDRRRPASIDRHGGSRPSRPRHPAPT